jgi:hypothetical protein
MLGSASLLRIYLRKKFFKVYPTGEELNGEPQSDTTLDSESERAFTSADIFWLILSFSDDTSAYPPNCKIHCRKELSTLIVFQNTGSAVCCRKKGHR